MTGQGKTMIGEKVKEGTVNRSCTMEENEIGLYNLKIVDSLGRIVVSVRNVSFLRAVSLLEENIRSK